MNHVKDDQPADDFDRGLGFDLQTLVSRRRMLLAIGGAGLGVIGLAACGSADGDPAASNTAADSPTTTLGTSAGTSAATTSKTAASSSVAAACVDEIPEETAGPYPGDGSNGVNVLTEDGIVRSDITSSFGASTTVADGIPLAVTLTIEDASCTPMSGAAVYLWHCDADGNYSMYSRGVEDENYLRGVQQTDTDGQVTFTTIVPGCYPGRWPHMHFEVYDSLDSVTAGANNIKTSQLAIPQATCEVVYAHGRYPSSAGNLSRISLTTDNVFGDDGGIHQLATMSGSNDTGYTADLVVGV